MKVLISKLQLTAAQLRYLPGTLALVWEAARYWAVAWFALLVAQGLMPVAVVYLTRAIVDRLVASVGAGADWRTLRPLLLLVSLMAAVLLLLEGMRSASRWIRTLQSELLKDHISTLIHKKCVGADLAFYESPDYYDHLHRAREEASYRPVALIDTLGGLLQNCITLMAMGAVLIPYGWWLPVALLLSTLPAFYVVLRYAVRQHVWRLGASADERRTWYYDWLLTAREPAAEVRLFALGDHFQSTYRSLRKRLREGWLRLDRDRGLAELTAGTLALFITGIVMVWMLRRALAGEVTMGDLVMFYQAFNIGHSLMRSLLENVGHLYANTLFLGNLFEFLALESRVVDSAMPEPAPVSLRDGIRFDRVTFRYPGSERPALDDFSLMIPAGRIVAIVGLNGAGKSTLIKLLCRLYDAGDGRVEIDGADLRNMRVAELRRLITVLFQEPVHYNTSVAENIAVGDLAASPSAVDIETAARAAGADTIIARLPEGYDSVLGKWFASGTDLSVGEWQRIALSRAFLRDAPIILLDEPTSAMDSWAESEWLSRFRSLSAGRTVVIITHRFTTAMQADTIHVMAEGRIVESGSHLELLAREGLYARSWRAQWGDHAGELVVEGKL